jgi:hypothetical protein
MEINYNKDKRVRITKPGIFDNAIGTIKSIKIEVDLGYGMGTWSFAPSEMELIGSIPKIETMSELATEVKKVVEPTKRTYKKREPKASDKPKQKRSYNKKAKS